MGRFESSSHPDMLNPITRSSNQAAGHEVFTPTLTGCGERSHLLTPGVGLSTHVQDVVNVLEYEDLEGVILAGHSFAGVVITAVADRVPGRIARLVYTDAAAPENGQNATGAFQDGTAAVLAGMSEGNKESWLLPPLPLSSEGITSPEHVAWVSPKRCPLPLLAPALARERVDRRLAREEIEPPGGRPPERVLDGRLVDGERGIERGDDEQHRIARLGRRALRRREEEEEEHQPAFSARAGTSASTKTESSSPSIAPRAASARRMSIAFSCGTAFLYGRSEAVSAS